MIARMSPRRQFELVAKQTDFNGLERSAEPIDATLPHGAELSPTGLYLPTGLQFEEWKEVGQKLATLEQGIQWALGDWWAYGHHAYGDRADAAKKLPYEFGSLMNLGRVARKVPTSLRNEVLSFSHHEAVAKLESDDQKKSWLERAARAKWPVHKLRERIANSARTEEIDPIAANHRWATELVQQIERQRIEHHHGLLTLVITKLSDGMLNQLLIATRGAARKWNDVADMIEGFQRDRQKPLLQRERLPPAERQSATR